MNPLREKSTISDPVLKDLSASGGATLSQVDEKIVGLKPLEKKSEEALVPSGNNAGLPPAQSGRIKRKRDETLGLSSRTVAKLVQSLPLSLNTAQVSNDQMQTQRSNRSVIVASICLPTSTTGMEQTKAFFEQRPMLQSLTIRFNYKWDCKVHGNWNDGDHYFKHLKEILDNFENPSSLKTLRFQGFQCPYDFDFSPACKERDVIYEGLGMQCLEYIGSFLEKHNVKLNNLYLHIETIEENLEIESLPILMKLKTFTKNMVINAALHELSIEDLQKMRQLQLKGLLDSTYDEDLKSCPENFVYNGTVDEYVESYIAICLELANWPELEELDLSYLDFIDRDVFKKELDEVSIELMLVDMNSPSSPKAKELFGQDNPELPAYAVRRQLFDAIAQLQVQRLTLHYPHCKVHSLLQECLQKGLKNLVEIRIHGYNEVMGSAEELAGMITSQRKDLRCTIECNNSWQIESQNKNESKRRRIG